MNYNINCLCADEICLWKALEHIVCLKEGILHWNSIQPKIKDGFGVRHADCGIDALSPDMKQSYQVKLRTGKSARIKWRELGTFIGASFMFGIRKPENMFLMRNEGSRISMMPEGMNDVAIDKQYYKEFYKKVCRKIIDYGYKEHIKKIEKIERILIDLCPEIKFDEFHFKEEKINVKEKHKKEITLRPYQEKAIIFVEGKIKEWDEQKKCDEKLFIQMACGCGKSVVMANIVKKNMRKKILIFVPSLTLREQMKDVLKKHAGVEPLLLGTGFNDKNEVKIPESACVLCVNNSVDVVREHAWDMIIIDEAHHVCQPYYYKDGSDLDETIARKITNMTGNKIMFSATLNYADFSYGIREAIDSKYLTDYDVTIPVVTDDAKDERWVMKTILKNHPEYLHVLAYCNTKEFAKSFDEYLVKCGIKSQYFDGDTSLKDRIGIMKDFKAGKFRVLVSVDIIREGIDLPIADTCMFVEGRSSPIQVIQCMGRILRLYEGKPLAHVILPNYDENGGVIKKFFKSINATDEYVEKMGSHSSRYKVEKVVEEKEERDICEGKDEDVTEKIYDSLGRMMEFGNFNHGLELLRRYMNDHNGELPKLRTVYDDFNLGAWCNNRRLEKKGIAGRKISQQQVSQLESISGWKWELFKGDDWEQNRLNWVRYHRDKTQFTMAEKIRLGKWANTTRRQYKKEINGGERLNGRNFLTDERKRILVEGTEGWVWDGTNKVDFWEMFNDVKEYKEKYGMFPKRKDKNEEGQSMGSWVETQRSRFTGRRKPYNKHGDKDKIEALYSIGIGDGIVSDD